MNTVFSVSDRHIAITQIRTILKEYMVKGRVIPPNKYRYSDCLVCVLGGDAEYVFSTHTIEVKKGDILFIAKGSTYEYDIRSKTYDYIYLDFDFDYPPGFVPKSQCFSEISEQSSRQLLFERMNKLWLLRSPGYYEHCMSSLYQIYAEMIQKENKPYASAAARNLSEQVALYIAAHCTNQHFHIGQAAKEFGRSETHLRRLFKQEFGITPMAYATRIRLDKARYLLENTQYSISMIAEMTGFKDAFYFSRIFKNILGCTPSLCRKCK